MARYWSLGGLSWWQLAKRTCLRSWHDEVFGQSARLAFYLFFALFPVLLLLLSLLGESTVSGSGWRSAMVVAFQRALPPDAATLLTTTSRQLNAAVMAGTGAIFAFLGAVWGALNGTWAIMTGLNKAYEVTEERTWWQVFVTMVGVTLALSVLGLVALTTSVYSVRLAGATSPHLGREHAIVEFLLRLAQRAVIALVLLSAAAVLYRFGPAPRNRRWRSIFPGAVVALILWICFSLLLRVYQQHSSSSQEIYGGLNAVTTLLMWLYLTGAAIFLGGEANSAIENSQGAQG